MIDESTAKGRIIAAALRLAARGPWNEVSLNDIAVEAGEPFAGLRDHFKSKGHIIKAFVRAIDDDVLAKPPRKVDGETARDRIFEVLMSRFDALTPHKDAVRSIAKTGSFEPDALKAVMASQAWMLNAAGISTDGLGGRARVAGLTAIHSSVFNTWLDDDDPGMAKTMAALDRRLRRGERTYERASDVVGGIGKAGEAMAGMVERLFGRRDGKPDVAPDAPTAASSSE